MIENFALHVKNIRHQFPNGRIVLQNVSMEAEGGAIVCILGRSGCGKSTLMNIISGLLPVQQGQIILNGTAKGTGPSRFISYSRQVPTLLAYRSAWENALLAAELRNELTEQTKQDAESLFELFGLADAKDLFAHELSVGMRSRVSLIQQIILDTPLYLLDEPFAALDTHVSKTIESFLWKLVRHKKRSCVMITHDLSQVAALSDKVFIMESNPGRIITQLQAPATFQDLDPQARKLSPDFNPFLLQIIQAYSTMNL